MKLKDVMVKPGTKFYFIDNLGKDPNYVAVSHVFYMVLSEPFYTIANLQDGCRCELRPEDKILNVDIQIVIAQYFKKD